MSSLVNMQIPLPLAPSRQSLQIIRIIGRQETVKRLSSMGILPNSTIEIIQHADGNLIIGVGSSRIAMAYSLAQKVIVQPNENI